VELESGQLIKLTVEGKPASKGRPRFDPRTRRTYSPPSNIIGENDVRSVWREAGSPRFEDKPPLALDVTITVMRPDSHFKKSGDLSTEGLRHPYPENKKPDIDNAIKLIMDALNTRAYKDDVQIVRANVRRIWGEWPVTTIVISEVVNSFMQ
jgi:Holliday junction resolvase RusA-like endonuclease